MTKTILLPLAVLLLLLAACGEKRMPAQQPTQTNGSNQLPGDSTVYGLACDGTTDSLLVLLPYTGEDPDTFDIINASQQKQIFGKPFIGDELAVVLNPEDKGEALSVINLDDLKGEWAFLVKPKLRDYDKLPRRLRRRMMAEMPDSVKESLLVPREYVLQFQRGYTMTTKGMKRQQTTDEMNAVVYPDIKRYTEWHLYNGHLIMTSGTMEMPPGGQPQKQRIDRDTCRIVQLSKDTLVLRFDDGDWGFYRKRDR